MAFEEAAHSSKRLLQLPQKCESGASRSEILLLSTDSSTLSKFSWCHKAPSNEGISVKRRDFIEQNNSPKIHES